MDSRSSAIRIRVTKPLNQLQFVPTCVQDKGKNYFVESSEHLRPRVQLIFGSVKKAVMDSGRGKLPRILKEKSALFFCLAARQNFRRLRRRKQNGIHYGQRFLHNVQALAEFLFVDNEWRANPQHIETAECVE